MEERLAVVWAVCRNSVDTDPGEQQVALVVSVDVAAARVVVVACAFVEIPSESEARISVTPRTPRHFACRCAVVDCAGASAGTLFVPS